MTVYTLVTHLIAPGARRTVCGMIGDFAGKVTHRPGDETCKACRRRRERPTYKGR